MNKTNMLKVLLVIMITVGLISITTQVFADGMLDLSNTLQGGTTTNESASGNTLLENTNTNNGLQNETNTNNSLQNVASPNSQNTNNNVNANKNNVSSSYTESNLPDTGVETSVLAIAAFIAFAIIGIYTFMKLSDYSNI